MALKILLTGAAGFVGSHVARRLVAEGCEVTALLRPTTDAWRISDLSGAMRTLAGDLAATEAIERCVDEVRPEVCIHLAWYVEPGRYLAGLENLTMAAASLHLARRLAEAGCRRFVGAGTCFEYDTTSGRLSEESPTRPATLYAASKLGLCLTLEHLGRTTGMEVAWPRFFYMYGPSEDRRRLVPTVIRSLLAGQEVQLTRGTQVRDYLHVEDVAAAVWAVARSDLVGPVNVGSGVPVTVREVVEHLGVVLGGRDRIVLGALPDDPADPRYVCADIRYLTERTGWSPRIDLKGGLSDVAAWWRAHLAVA